MKSLQTLIEKLRKMVEEKSMLWLRCSLGLVFIWFGALKFFVGASDAKDIASDTIQWLSACCISDETAMPLLASLECIIGIGLLSKRFIEWVIPILYLQMAGTLLPLALFPEKTWKHPLVPTLEGQYIIKNVVLIAAAITLGAAVKGRKQKIVTKG